MIYIGGFSGGIDSQAAARWMLNRYGAENVVLVNTDAGGNEHPLTMEHVAWYSANIHPVVRVSAEMRDIRSAEWCEAKGHDPSAVLSFPQLAKMKGTFPSSSAQFCTEALKLAPLLRWVRQQYPDGDYARFSGVRRDESRQRQDAAFVGFDDYYDCELHQPIADWTKQMAFDYVRAHGEQINPLYSLGFDRVGCAPCIHAGKDDLLNWVRRFPEMIDKIRGWEAETQRTFFAPRVPGIRPRPSPRNGAPEVFNWIDEVVEWAKTDRGGRQQNIFRVLNEPASCESKFGLCE